MDKNFTNYNLCRMNLLLHGAEYDQLDIACENTLVDPKNCGEFRATIVSNPTCCSFKWEGSDSATLIDDARFSKAGVCYSAQG